MLHNGLTFNRVDEMISLVVCLISKGVETISPKGRRMIIFETSIPIKFVS